MAYLREEILAVYGRKIPWYPLFLSMVCGAKVHLRQAVEGFLARDARADFSKSLIKSLMAGNS
jgi:hypothetical protein